VVTNAESTARIETIERVKEVLGLAHTSDPETEQAIGYDVDAALRWLSALTEVNWSPSTGVASVRRYNAPPSSLRNIDNLQPSPTPVVTLEGVTLVADIDYRLIYNATRTAYVQIERRAEGMAVEWIGDVVDAAGAIEVTGEWSETADVSDVWVAKSVQLYRNRGLQYAGMGGNAVLGISSAPASDEELINRLLVYWRAPVRQIERIGTP
jgi:hypothetical protein